MSDTLLQWILGLAGGMVLLALPAIFIQGLTIIRRVDRIELALGDIVPTVEEHDRRLATKRSA